MIGCLTRYEHCRNWNLVSALLCWSKNKDYLKKSTFVKLHNPIKKTEVGNVGEIKSEKIQFNVPTTHLQAFLQSHCSKRSTESSSPQAVSTTQPPDKC